MLSAKIVIMGPPGGGCHEILDTIGRATGAVAGATGERALEFRRWDVSSDLRIQFYGVVAHATLEFAWATVCKGLSGAVVACDAGDAARLEQARRVLSFLADNFDAPLVVAGQGAGEPGALSVDELRLRLGASEDVAVVPSRFGEWASVKQAIMVLFYAIRARIERDRGRLR